MSWKKIRLGDSATFINGYPFKPTEWNTVGRPIIRIQDLTGNAYESNYFNGRIPSKYLVKNGDILISWSASLGVYEWDKEDAWLNQHIFKVVLDKSEVDKRFFKYLLQEKVEEMKSAVHGATMKHITKGRFDSIEIKIPDLPTQKHIASILDKADALRQQNRQLLNYYDELLQSTFIEMFGDPETNPLGLPLVQIRDLVTEVKYGTSKPAEESGLFKYLRMNNITYDGFWDFNSLKYINLEDIEKSKYLLKRGDLVFNRTNSKELVGKTALFDSDETMAIAGYLIRVRMNEKASPTYVWRYLNSIHGKTLLTNMCKSIVGMANINAQELQDIKILLPDISQQNHFSKVVKEIEVHIRHTRRLLEESDNLFQRLIYNYFKN